MNFVPHFNLFGIDAKQIPSITGTGAPTTATVGAVGCFYMDTETGNTYKCIAVADDVYTWEPFGDGSGDNIEIVQTIGESKTTLMSQKATTDNFNAIREAFNVEGGYLNILDPENCESGYYDDELGKVSSSNHIRTIKPIPVNVSKVYIKSNINTPPSDAVVVFIKLDENGEFVEKTNTLLPSSTDGEITMDVLKPAVKMHVWMSGASAYSFNNLCISTIREVSFEHYNAPPKIKALKLDMFPEEVKDFEKSGFEPINVLEGVTLTTTKGATWNASGKIVTTQYSGNYTSISPLIDVIGGCSYMLPNYAGVVELYDQDGKNGVQVVSPSTNNKCTMEFTVPVGKAKVGISFINTLVTSVTEMYRTTPTKAENTIINETLSIIPKNISKSETISLLCPLKGKVIVNLGDSIFGNARPPEDISTMLAELTGAIVHNCGFGGCRMSEHPYSRYDAFSMYRLANAITTGDFSLQDAALLDEEGVPSYFAETVALLKSIDFNNVDIITISYGTNDWNGGYNSGGGYSLTEPNEPLNPNTLKGALRYSIETILAAYPHIRIFVCSICYGTYLDSSNNFVEDTNTYVKCNFTAFDCIEQLLTVAEEYNLKFIDNYNIGINKVNRLNYFPANDGVHHNINGRRLLAEHIAHHLF